MLDDMNETWALKDEEYCKPKKVEPPEQDFGTPTALGEWMPPHKRFK